LDFATFGKRTQQAATWCALFSTNQKYRMNELSKQDLDSSDDALLTIIAQKGMEAFDKFIDKYADNESKKIDTQKEVAFKRIESTERIKNRENIVGGVAMIVFLVVFVYLSVTDNLTVGTASILSAGLVGSIGKFLGFSLPKREE